MIRASLQIIHTSFTEIVSPSSIYLEGDRPFLSYEVKTQSMQMIETLIYQCPPSNLMSQYCQLP